MTDFILDSLYFGGTYWPEYWPIVSATPAPVTSGGRPYYHQRIVEAIALPDDEAIIMAAFLELEVF